MDKRDLPTSHGVFKPVGHVVISFPTQHDCMAAQAALRAVVPEAEAITVYTAQAMSDQAAADIERGATGMASLGQELNLIKAHKVLADLGFHFLVVQVNSDEQAAQVAATSQAHNAERAQHYGRFIIEELITPANGEAQVADTPDRGLDAQMPSGLESERALNQTRR